MLIITITPETARLLRHIREWFGRVFAMGLIAWSVWLGMPHTTPASPVIIRSTDAVWASTTTSITSTSSRRRVLRVTRPTNPITCLAQNLYFEAKNEPTEGLEAIAATVFNRMDHGIRPLSMCAVIYQPFQYSWTLNTTNWSHKPPAKFVQMATQFWNNRAILRETYPVTHFHRVDIQPRWSATLVYVNTIGQHKFYRTES